MKGLFSIIVGVATAIFLAFIIIPIISVFVSISPTDLLGKVVSNSVQEPLRLSLVTASVSVAIIFTISTPLSYALARKEFHGKTLVDALIDVPIVLPPAVAGLALLLAFAPRGLIGGYLASAGIILPGTVWAVILAQVFVSSPFYYRSAKTAFESVDRRAEDSARILSRSDAGVFLRITLPLARKGIAAGLILAWARALGEFGATLMFAGNLPGVTQTMPLAIYMSMGGDTFASNVLSVILLLFSLAILVSFRVIGEWRRPI